MGSNPLCFIAVSIRIERRVLLYPSLMNICKLLLGQKHLEASQVSCMSPLIGLTRWDKQRNVDITSKLNQDNIVDEIRNYKQN